MAERYELLELLGKGGFGRVYLARFHGEAGFQKDVALKFLKSGAQDNRNLIARLRDEARLLGLLRHRAIVHVDRLIRLQGAWVIVMEYVPGADLSSFMKDGPVPPGPTLEVLSEVASALTAAYERSSPDGQALRLTHRDIKPGNIRLTDFGDVKVLDFGIARAQFAGQEVSGSSAIVGTPAYMAPERFEGQDGPASDVYALGVVAYEMLTSSRFGAQRTTRKAHREHLRACSVSLQGCPGLPEEAATLILGMLNHDPTLRPTTAEVRQVCRRLASSCEPALSEWVQEHLERTPGVNPDTWAPDGFERPGTSIIVDEDGRSGLAEGSLLDDATGAVFSPDLTGQMIGQSLTPDVQDLASTLAEQAPPTLEDPVGPSDLTPLPPDSPAPNRRPLLWFGGALAVGAALFLGLQIQEDPQDGPTQAEVGAPTATDGGRAADAGPEAAAEPKADGPGEDGGTEGGEAAGAADEGAGSAETPAGDPTGAEDKTAKPPAGASAEEPRVTTGTAPPRDRPADVAKASGSSSGADRSPPATTAPAAPPPTDAGVIKRPQVEMPPAGVRVQVAGDAQWVELRGQGRTHSLPATVPPGTYEIRVAFDGEASESGGSVTVRDGQPITVTCKGFFRQCEAGS